MNYTPILLIISSKENLDYASFEAGFDTLVLIMESGFMPEYKLIDVQETSIVAGLIKMHNITDVIAIAEQDKYDPHRLKKSLAGIFSAHQDLTLIFPHQVSPASAYREDGNVRSFIAAAAEFTEHMAHSGLNDFGKMVYMLVQKHISSPQENHIEIIQVGKPASAEIMPTAELAENALLVITGEGPGAYTERSLRHLNMAADLPGNINLCLDNAPYEAAGIEKYPRLQPVLAIYKNDPEYSNACIAKHYLAYNTDKEYIFFQDAGDIPLKSAFSKQMAGLLSRKLDVAGSHELIADRNNQAILIRRYPLDVNSSLSPMQFHIMVQRVSLISKEAYLKAGGFNTQNCIEADLQFFFRAFFDLRIGNIDDFLYIRSDYTRPPITAYSSMDAVTDLSSFLYWRWNIDFRLIKENKLSLADSSIYAHNHTFNYNLVRADLQ